MQSATHRVVLVTGASRGIGAEVARRLADADTHVIVHYRDHADHAAAVVDAIRGVGGHASALAADISDGADATAMFEAITRRFGRLDALVLNASGGLEFGADPSFAMRRNRDAQRRMARLALPLLPAGGHIVFVTSHQAHFYPYKAVPKGYAPVAASGRAGEATLHAMRPEFTRAGIYFTVVSGDMIAQTAPASEPTVNEVAAAIARAATAPNPSGTVFVGGADHPTHLSA